MSEIEFFKGPSFRQGLLVELNREMNTAIMREAGRMLCARADSKDFEGFRAILENIPHAINGKDAVGDTPLICAVFAGDRDTFDLALASPHIDINDPGEDNITALIHAVQEEDPYFALQLLEHPKIDVKRKDKDGDNAVTATVYSENLAVLERLLPMQGVDVMERNNEGESAASLADNLPNNRKNNRIRELIRSHESYRDTYGDIKSGEFRHLAVAHPYPHAVAFLRWADNQPGISTLRRLSKKIPHGDSFLLIPQLRNFVTNPDALYPNSGARDSYDPIALSICKHIGYDPSGDYPLISGAESSPPRPAPGGAS